RQHQEDGGDGDNHTIHKIGAKATAFPGDDEIVPEPRLWQSQRVRGKVLSGLEGAEKRPAKRHKDKERKERGENRAPSFPPRVALRQTVRIKSRTVVRAFGTMISWTDLSRAALAEGLLSLYGTTEGFIFISHRDLP